MHDRMVHLLEEVAERQNQQAFREVFDHFAPRIKAYLVSLGSDHEQAEEVMQEAMTIVWNKAHTYNSGQSSPATWIYTIARNKRIDLLRKMKPDIPEYDYSLLLEEYKHADDVIANKQNEKRLRRALKKLSAEQIEVLQLAFWQDQSHGTISESSGLPLGTVKSRIRLAMQRLRTALEEES